MTADEPSANATGATATIACRVALRIAEQRHETVVHVQLLMAVEQRVAAIIGDEIEAQFLVAPEHDHVLENARGWLAVYLGQLETVAMQMQGVNVVAGVTESQPIASPLSQRVNRSILHHGEGLAVHRPLVESVECGIVFLYEEIHRLVRRGMRGDF